MKKSTKSGFDFETRIGNNLSESKLFKNSEWLSNIYNYTTDLINKGVSDINELFLDEEQMFLIKNYPLFNCVDNRIEFCIRTKKDTCYVECKYLEVGGTAYQKLGYYLTEHAITHGRDGNSYMVVVYDGNDFKNTQTRKHVQNIKTNYIGYNFRQLILEVGEFEGVFINKLLEYQDISEAFKAMKASGY